VANQEGDGTCAAGVADDEGSMGDDRLGLSLGLSEPRGGRKEFLGNQAS
jgi:hypothetical protein